MLFSGKSFFAVATLASLGSSLGSKALGRYYREEKPETRSHLQEPPGRSLIVGGTPRDIPDYFVDLLICGGTLVHEDVVLTAAHCNNPFLPGVAYVGPNGDFRELTKATMHPAYGSNHEDFDFMLAKIDKIDNPTLVELNPNSAIPAVNDDIRIMGHGIKSFTDPGDDFTFTEATLQVVSNAQCAAAYSNFDVSNFDGLPVTEQMYCAAAPGKDSCHGDSGGPAIVGDNTQVGIISWGIGCADPDFPGVYAKVSEAYDWIQRQICCLSENPPADCPVVRLFCRLFSCVLCVQIQLVHH